MADIADIASETEESNIAASIAKAKKASFYRLDPEGYCHECGDDVADERLFCNGECATGYDRRLNKLSGRR